MGQKAEETLACAKLRASIRELKGEIDNQLRSAGQLVYATHKGTPSDSDELQAILERLDALFRQAGVESGHVAILLRTVAAALVTRLCGDLCRDGGSQALATVVELAGAAAALLIALPLLEAVAGLLLGYFT